MASVKMIPPPEIRQTYELSLSSKEAWELYRIVNENGGGYSIYLALKVAGFTQNSDLYPK